MLPPVAASLLLIINYKYDYTWPQLLKSFDPTAVLLSSFFFLVFMVSERNNGAKLLVLKKTSKKI